MGRTIAVAALLATAAIASPLRALQQRQDITPVETISDITNIANPSATPLPEGPSQDYKNVKCNYGALTSERNPTDQIWSDAQASAAWEDVKAAWVNSVPTDRDVNVTFADHLTDFFHAPPAMECGTMTQVNCRRTINCGEGGNAGQPVANPGGWVLVNSLVSVNNAFQNIYTSFVESIDGVVGDVGNFVAAFSPIGKEIEDQAKQKLILDGLLIGLTLAIAPSLHVSLSKLKWPETHENAAASLVDSTYGVLGGSFAFAKDSMEALSPLTVQNALAPYVTSVSYRWRDALGNGTKAFFNDPDQIWNTIKDGRALYTSFDQSPGSTRDDYKRTIFASALPYVWASSSEPLFPVIINADGLDGGDCQSKDPNSYDTGNDMLFQFGDGVVSSARICDDRGGAYWLLAAAPKHSENLCNCPIMGGACTDTCKEWRVGMSTVAGWDKLGEGATSFGGLTKEGVVFNAVNTWAANGNKNNRDVTISDPDWTNADAVQSWITSDLSKTKGLVRLPVCSIAELADTVWNDFDNTKGNMNYPCPATAVCDTAAGAALCNPGPITKEGDPPA